MDQYVAGAMEIGADPVPPVPPDLDLELDLEIDFDSLPEIEIPGESLPPPPPPPKAPAQKGASRAGSSRRVHEAIEWGADDHEDAPPRGHDESPHRGHEESPRRSFAWWPLLGGAITLLVVALAAVPFAILRLNDMSRDMSLLSDRVEQAETENAKLTESLAREAVDAVSTHLADTERRIERIRGALDEVRRGQTTPAVAQAPKEEPKPVPAVAKAPAPAAPVQPQPELPKPVATAPLLPPPPDLPEPRGGPLVGASKKDRVEPISPASAVRAAPAPPVPVEKAAGKVELPTPLPREEARPAPSSGRMLLPTELYDENDGD